ncbi:MAG: class I SAM-dependent methyltransferase [Bacteroidota bacterium]
MKEVKDCPACGSGISISLAKAVKDFSASAGQMQFLHPSYAVLRCQDCSLCFKSHTADEKTLNEYYEKLPFSSYDRDTLYPTDKCIIALLKGLPVNACLLDLGCGAGRILGQLGKDYKCYGTEPNAEAARQAAGRGIKIITDGELKKGYESHFQAIVMTDVFEHLPQPLDTMSLLAAKLAPGGILILSTGDSDAVKPPELLAEFWYMRIFGHLQMLNRRHAEFLAQRTGLKLERYLNMSHYEVSMKERMKQKVYLSAYRQFRLKPGSFLSSLLKMIPVLNRASRWELSPIYNCGKDHALIVFRKA